MDAPSLRTDRLVLMPLGPADLDEAAAIFADPRVMAHIDGATRDRPSTARLLEANQRCWNAEGWGLWALRDATSGAFVGQAGLQRLTDIHGAAVEFSIIVSRRNWRQGIATEAGNAALWDAWERFGGSEIHAIVQPDNTAGQGILRRLGFRRQDDQLARGEEWQVWQVQRLG